ncbi:PREDICTED: carbon catabolite repressor protein 4 homolog 4 isoform X1 [Tarenaya hassleriana]|uniref:carbon catabolite repressor protein 4 homolog 4 isoform X1 n=1 Tax=Tarenaya hassleriana TaxID=28532 RepID=UPI00053C9239|nr:PREDICTED: carbon catabolite repressor protein 4 homolog 4 isoform X1 [Tarenaya hassleriana]
MSTKPVEPKSPNFISVEGADIHARSKPDGIRFRLVSYNILAQVYVKSSFFPHSPSACLKWKARSQAILTVLRNLKADFLCLQEVDEYDSFYKRNMESQGYSGIYIQRSGNKRDGCAIFYKDSCAELVTEERIEYNDLVDSIKEESIPTSWQKKNETAGETIDTEKEKNGKLQDRGDPNDPRVRLKRDCVGLMAAFRIKEPFHHIVIVANTHLYWDPEWADVKLAQASYLLSRLARFKEMVSDKYECTPSLLLAGDFNSTPGDKVYQYLVSGNVSAMEPVNSEEEEEEAPIPLCSMNAVTRGEPPFTNCTPDFTDTLDYIFFTPSDFIKPVSILELPEPESPDILGFLPNFHHPSDHLPIGAEFEITRE